MKIIVILNVLPNKAFEFISSYAMCNFCLCFLQLIRRYRLEYHHEPLDYAVTFMYAPDGPLRLRMIER